MAKSEYFLEVMLGASTAPSFRKNIRSAEQGLEKFGNTARTIAGVVGAAFAAVNIGQGIQDAVEVYSEFEQQMATTSSIAKATKYEYELLETAAKEVGRTTTATATESAEALEYMSLAGWDVSESVQGLRPTVELTEATGAELKTTSDLVTDSMSALGLEVKDLQGYLDMLVESNNDANTTAEQLMEGLVKTGGAARVLGADLDDTITAMGILANNGKKGMEAGTAMNAILVRMAGNKDAIKWMDKLGIKIWDSNGKFIGLRESLIAMNDAMKNLTDQEKARALKGLAGTHYYSQMEYLLDAVSDSIDGQASSWDKLEQSIANSDGALSNMYATTTDTVSAAYERSQSALDIGKIDIVEIFGDDAKDFLNWAAEKTPEVTDSIRSFMDKHHDSIVNSLKDWGEGISNLGSRVMAVGGWLMDHKGLVEGTLTSIGTAYAISKVQSIASSIMELGTAFMALPTPVGAAVAALTLGAGAFVGIRKAMKEAREEAKEADFAERFGSISLSLDEIKEIAADIVVGGNLNLITQMLSSAAENEDAFTKIKNDFEELNKTSWIIGSGFSFDTGDSSEYKSRIDSYVNDISSYVQSRAYENNLANKILFGDESKQGLSDAKYFGGIEDKIDKLKSKISKKLKKALEDGVIDADENEAIEKLLVKLQKMTDAISQFETQSAWDKIDLKYKGVDLTANTFMKMEEEISSQTANAIDAAEQAYSTKMQTIRSKHKEDSIEFQNEQKQAMIAAYNQETEAVMNGMGYILDTLDSNYGEIQEKIPEYNKSLQQWLTDTTWFDLGDSEFAWSGNFQKTIDSIADNISNLSSLDQSTKDALNDLYQAMAPDIEMMQELANKYIAAGEKVPESLQQGIDNAIKVGALAGNKESIYQIIGNQIAGNEELENLVKEMQENGEEIPAGILRGMQDGTQAMTPQVTSMIEVLHNHYVSKAKETFGQPLNLDTKARINLNAEYHFSSLGMPTDIQNKIGWAKHATGGIFNTPHYGVFAEEGPEAFIPMDGSENAKSIWRKAGEMLGVYNGSSKQVSSNNAKGNTSNGSKVEISFHPQIIIQGNASKQDVNEAMELSMENLRTMMEQVVAGQSRVSFS